MAATKSFVKPKRWMTGISCVGLAVMSMIPATAVSAEAARLQEGWMRAEEVETIAEPQDFSDTSIEEHGYDDGSVTEIDGSQETESHSSVVDWEKTISANTRYLYQYRNMSAGETIDITVKCDDRAITYKIGIKNQKTGEMVSVSGSGTLIHAFKISESGTYTAFFENNNNFPINILSAAVY